MSTSMGNKKVEEDTAVTIYLCMQCGSQVSLNKTQHIQCRECDYRIVVKKSRVSSKYLAR